MSSPHKQVFVSHSHSDNAFSRQLVSELQWLGLTVWYDEMSLGAGHLGPSVERELRASDAFIVVLSPAAVASQWVQSEWYAAWSLMGEGKITTFIPVIKEPCDIPLMLRGMHWVDFTNQPFAAGVAQLAKLLSVAPDGSAAPLPPRVTGTLAAPPPPDQWGLVASFQAHPVRGCFSVAFSPDGKLLASGSYDQSIAVWDVATHQEVSRFTGHTKGIDAVAWSPDGQLLASASFGHRIRLWHVRDGGLHTLEGHTDGVADVAWSPDGTRLVSGSADQTLRVWDAVSGKCQLVLRGHTGPITSVAWSPDGAWLGSTARDATIRTWEATTGSPGYVLAGHQSIAYCMRWSPDGKLIASSGHTTVRVWDAARATVQNVFAGHTGHVLRLAWRPDGAIIASGSADRNVRLWNVRTGKALVTLSGHGDWVHGVAWSPDGQLLASCGGAQDGTIKLWGPV